MATLEQKQIIRTSHKHCEDGNSVTAPRLRGGSPTALPQRWGQRINRSSFTLKAVMLQKASTARMGAVHQETKLDQELSSAPALLSARLLPELLEQIAGMKNYPPPATLSSASSPPLQDSPGGMPVIYSGTYLGYAQGTKLGS